MNRRRYEVAVRLLGAVRRVDLIASGALDDRRVDLAVPNRPQQVLVFGEARAHRLGMCVMVGLAGVIVLEAPSPYRQLYSIRHSDTASASKLFNSSLLSIVLHD
jgi:hypothetical protein